MGSGKSHVAGKLASVLGYKEFNVGQLFRKMAEKEGLTIDEFYSRLKNNPAVERAVDEEQKKFLRENDNVVVQGRIAWYFAKESPFAVFNVFLSVNPETMAMRTSIRPEYNDRTLGEIINLAAAREEEERERYKNLYCIENHLDPLHYHFVVDTTDMSPDEVVTSVLNKFKKVRLP